MGSDGGAKQFHAEEGLMQSGSYPRRMATGWPRCLDRYGWHVLRANAPQVTYGTVGMSVG